MKHNMFIVCSHCRGIDDRELTFGHVRKSVSAEVNYGIRFQSQEEAEKFLHQLSCEVKNRLQEIQMKTKCITLKLMVGGFVHYLNVVFIIEKDKC